MKKIILLLGFAWSYQSMFAQRIQFADISLYGGAGSTQANHLTTSEVNFLRSNMLNPFRIGMQYSTSNTRYSNQVGIMAGWNIAQKHKSKLSHQLRTGFSFGSYQLNLEGSKHLETRIHVDTLVSSQTGNSYFIDSVFNQHSSLNHNANMLNLDISYIVRLESQRKFSVFTGLGLQAGFSLQNFMSSDYHESSYVEDYPNINRFAYRGNRYSSSAVESETRNLGSTNTYRMFVPIGLNYRLSNKSFLLKHINLFATYNIGIEFNRFEGISNNTGFYQSFHVGTRISFLDPNMSTRTKLIERIRKHRRNY